MLLHLTKVTAAIQRRNHIAFGMNSAEGSLKFGTKQATVKLSALPGEWSERMWAGHASRLRFHAGRVLGRRRH